MAKRFCLTSFSILCLMLSALVGLHLGGQSVQAQKTAGAEVGTWAICSAAVEMPLAAGQTYDPTEQAEASEETLFLLNTSTGMVFRWESKQSSDGSFQTGWVLHSSAP